MQPKKSVWLWVVGGLWLLGASPLAAISAPATPADAGFQKMLQVADAELPEISGLAASRRWPGTYWALNDSGGTPTLYAFNRRGEVISRVEVTGAHNVDWEDLALFEQDGRSWLAIADTGDNLAWRSGATVYVVAEPEPGDLRVAVDRRIDFRYPDGPRDVEALAVDVAGQQILLLEKGPAPVGFYALPLRPGSANEPLVARRQADVALKWPGTPALVAPIGAQRFRGAVTAMDLSRDGRWLAVMTYSHLFAFRHEAGQDWVESLKQPTRVWRLPRQGGLESMAIDPDGRSVVVAPEGNPAPLYRAKGILGP